MNKQHANYSDAGYGITRRRFIGTAAGGSAALLTGGLTSLLKPTVSAAGFDFIEATIPQLQAAMASGALTSAGLTMGYINRIQSLNPTLHAVIEIRPHRWGWKVFEAPGVEPVFPEKRQAINYA